MNEALPKVLISKNSTLNAISVKMTPEMYI